ncbi:protein cornichon homolog 1 isoform X1 [Punica granatum]|uniref:Protein cornichon homolog 1 isoform X1 n=2 Tax=Punica granatum TaxID=22663 RepID=A0A6P8DII6_PUNGR|nr:protein cornichon homolog 1 isoform X1 [Punica granatum]
MVSALILSVTFLIINILLFASTFYQVLILSDLEADYVNMYEAASQINRWILPEFVLQGVLTLLLLVTGHWIMFLISVPLTCYHVMLYIKKRHLIDVTEIFRVIGAEKKYRLVKLGLLSILFLCVIFRLVFSIFESFVDEDDSF